MVKKNCWKKTKTGNDQKDRLSSQGIDITSNQGIKIRSGTSFVMTKSDKKELLRLFGAGGIDMRKIAEAGKLWNKWTDKSHAN